MGIAGTVPATVTGRGGRTLAVEDNVEDSISPIEFTRNDSDGERDGPVLDLGWDEMSPGLGNRSAVEIRAYF